MGHDRVGHIHTGYRLAECCREEDLLDIDDSTKNCLPATWQNLQTDKFFRWTLTYMVMSENLQKKAVRMLLQGATLLAETVSVL